MFNHSSCIIFLLILFHPQNTLDSFRLEEFHTLQSGWGTGKDLLIKKAREQNCTEQGISKHIGLQLGQVTSLSGKTISLMKRISTSACTFTASQNGWGWQGPLGTS